MELKDKEKIVQIVGEAQTALTQLEERIHATEAQGKTPAKGDRQLLESVTRALNRLKENPFAGRNVPTRLRPAEYAALPNLFCTDLSRYWRLLYYVAGDEVRVISVVFEIIDHPHYDRIFGYHKK